VLVYFDQPPGLSGATGASWDAVREGIVQGAAASPAPTMVASTLPELLDEEDATALGRAGVAALAGLAAGLAGTAARRVAPGDPARLRAIAAACAATRAAAADALGYPVALKLSAPALRHKSEAGALLLGVRDADAVRAGFERLAARGGGRVLVEQMAAPGVELLVAARADAVVPALVLGLGGIWTELLDDVAIVPLPADRERVHAALRSLRGAPLLTGGRGRPALDLAAAADVAVAAADLLLRHGLALLELNPVIVHERGAVAVDAVARAAPPAGGGRQTFTRSEQT
jgi:acetyltransferase